MTKDVPIFEELRSAPDAWALFKRLAQLPHPLFFDSALQHPRLGRYSFAMADPVEWLTSKQGLVTHHGRSVAGNPFSILEANYRLDPVPSLPPFQGGWAGLFGYDLCHHLEVLPRPAIDDFQVPDLAVGWYDVVVSFDHAENRAWIVSTGYPEQDPERRRHRAEQRLEDIKRALGTTHEFSPRPSTNLIEPEVMHPVQSGLFSSFTRDAFLDAVARAVEYIHAGDVFQVNLAQRLLAPDTGSPLDLYEKLRTRNRAPFAGYFDLGDFAVLSASPERFLQVRDRHIETRPIKGTRPRSADAGEDARLRDELVASEKDRAENVMIVDLLRNDLGRVSEYRSIHVPQLCAVESYEFVHHLVSVVEGKLREGLTPIDLLRAAFPGGSVTGAPKIRAMEIIAELEPVARGPYCGSLGYLGCNGTMDSNILIRTFTIGRGWMQFPVGGGIVADSQPEAEHDETWHKAEGMLRALAR